MKYALSIASLAVLVTDSQHQPLPAAQAWLEGTDGRIESTLDQHPDSFGQCAAMIERLA